MKPGIPYAMWPVIGEATTDGWQFGSLMGYVDQEWGDAFVQAPDGSRAGLVWVVRDGPVKQLLAPSADRWGVYDVAFPRRMKNVDDLVFNFRAVLPLLQRLHRDASISNG
jgi:hypothetical protein